MTEIEKNIERLAEINCANNLIGIGQPLVDERQIITNYLKVMEVIETKGNGGFFFIGPKSTEYKKLYLDTFENF